METGTVDTGLLGCEEGPGSRKSEGQSLGGQVTEGHALLWGGPGLGSVGQLSALCSPLFSRAVGESVGAAQSLSGHEAIGALWLELIKKPPGSSGRSRRPPPEDSYEISPLFVAKLPGFTV